MWKKFGKKVLALGLHALTVYFVVMGTLYEAKWAYNLALLVYWVIITPLSVAVFLGVAVCRYSIQKNDPDIYNEDKLKNAIKLLFVDSGKWQEKAQRYVWNITEVGFIVLAGMYGKWGLVFIVVMMFGMQWVTHILRQSTKELECFRQYTDELAFQQYQQDMKGE